MLKTTKSVNTTPQVAALAASTTESILLMPGKPLKVLITRPKIKAQQLALLLDQQGIANTSQTLFDYQANASTADIATALVQADIVIFVSVAAVEFAHASYSLTKHLPPLVFAVGKATKEALLALGVKSVFTPPAEQEHSEGLLKLPSLATIEGKQVVIFRGNGGREHIAEGLRQRGAKVRYLESYQRVWRTLATNIAKQWQAQQINCIVVTSNDILIALTKYLATATDSVDNYWQTQCLWIVVSDRIEANAKALGLTRVINTHSARSQILSNTLRDISCLSA